MRKTASSVLLGLSLLSPACKMSAKEARDEPARLAETTTRQLVASDPQATEHAAAEAPAASPKMRVHDVVQPTKPTSAATPPANEPARAAPPPPARVAAAQGSASGAGYASKAAD